MRGGHRAGAPAVFRCRAGPRHLRAVQAAGKEASGWARRGGSRLSVGRSWFRNCAPARCGVRE
eukprot:2976152-Lingulodinium_polyedra.AAC.1